MGQLNGGTRLGTYEIIGLLGAGGMGEVYSASDTKLGRNIAIKILAGAWTHDDERVARFKREAKTLAALNHPNIAIIHGFEESGSQNFLVMELVEGDTLADKLARGPIPPGEALRIAVQISEALEAAHEKGIIHRDLKPANVKITPEGKVKVLDFGLAKAFENDASSGNLSNSPTLTRAGTGEGVILGTAAYMSPEQAKGFAVDPRSDVFSFGCILYEMLTGKPAFDGDSVSEILASVLKTEPAFHELPQTLHPRLRELVQRTLAKNPKRRMHAMADVRFEIESIMNSPSTDSPEVTAVPAVRSSLPAWILAALAVAALGWIAAIHFREKPAGDEPELRLDIGTPSTTAPFEFAISPNGRYIVFIASGDGAPRLWLRAFDKAEAQPLAGTEGAGYPFWSADSSSIAFDSGGRLRRVEIAGGPPQILASTFASFGGAWNSEGTILFSSGTGPLSRISAAGGETAIVTHLDSPRQVQHRFPKFLPDGRHFLFFVLGTPESAGIYLGSLDSSDTKRLVLNESAAEFLPPDMVAYVRGTTLVARHLDLKREELTGDPVTLADPVGFVATGSTGFSVSADGRIAYRGGSGPLRQLRWYDRTGKQTGAADEVDSATLLYPELSPDGEHVALNRTIQANTDIWLMDLVRHALTRFTFEAAIDLAPVWSPDAKQIVFASSRQGPYNLFIKSSSGAGADTPLLVTMNHKYPQDWSKDGRFLLYSEVDLKMGRDLWALPMKDTDPKPFPVVKTAFEELNGQFSPDSRFVAYETNESGRSEIVVQPFPKADGKWQVSTNGGVQPRWRPDGKELYFLAPDGKLMAVSIAITGVNLAAATPVALFNAVSVTGYGANKHEYMVTRDGRFLINQPAELSNTTPITLILNRKSK
jgi:eukaryotic-like serine/threonine-protein kinase